MQLFNSSVSSTWLTEKLNWLLEALKPYSLPCILRQSPFWKIRKEPKSNSPNTVLAGTDSLFNQNDTCERMTVMMHGRYVWMTKYPIFLFRWKWAVITVYSPVETRGKFSLKLHHRSCFYSTGIWDFLITWCTISIQQISWYSVILPVYSCHLLSEHETLLVNFSIIQSRSCSIGFFFFLVKSWETQPMMHHHHQQAGLTVH